MTEKDAEKIKLMKEGGKILAGALLAVSEEIKPGAVLKNLDKLAFDFIKKSGAEPAFLNYRPAGAKTPYPASLCSSVNEIVVHGAPNDYALKEGDIISIDLGVKFKGFITDAARTFPVGKISSEAAHLLKATREALASALKSAFPGKTIGDIGYAVEQVAEKNKVFVVKMLTGHGVGKRLHEEPTVYNYGNPGQGMKLFSGLTIAIEPMFSLGSENIFQLDDDSYQTSDGSLAAHFEDTIAITDNGPLILTA
ncbi:MAG: type I methionyl aminopeptidase [Candidatus Paceibacterota bacterium]